MQLFCQNTNSETVKKDKFKISRLSLEWNNIGSSGQGIETFCDAIGSNKSILNLDLRNNRISSADSSYIANLIRRNTVLQMLDLSWNELGNEGVKSFISALDMNQSLIQIELTGNKVNEDTLAMICKICV